VRALLRRRWFSFAWLAGATVAATTGFSVRDAAAQQSKQLTVSAAISLKDALDELGYLYEQRHPGTKITFNYSSSGTLQHQIEQGAPVDIFFSAGVKQMDALQAEGLLVPGARRDIVGNELVLIVPAGAERVKGFADLADPGVRTVAVGEPGTVPAGMYARQMFEHLGNLAAIEKKTVYAKDVRTVLTYVETGNAEAGIVYRTDAKSSTKVRVVTTAPAGSHDPIVYPAAVLKGSKRVAAARTFLEFLSSSEAGEIFAKYGFTAPEKTAEKN
jgi:molybdate transport system substrate-binding protein